jgi:phage-related protein (TIGR01555 family)
MAKSTKKTGIQKRSYTKKNTTKEVIHNSIMQEALFSNIPGLPGYGVMLSQSDTLFKNLRWYLVSNMRQLLSELYVELGLVQAMVDVPVDDGFRGGVEIVTKQLDPDDIKKLESEIEHEGDIIVAAQATKWTRLYGGGGIIIATDQPSTKPLNISAINKNTPLQFKAADMWELFWGAQNIDDGEDIVIGKDETVQQLGDQWEMYNYYGVSIHQTRVMRMKGLVAPSFIRPRLRGWGFSALEPLVRPINVFLKTANVGFEVLDEFKVDVFKIKNLASTLTVTGGLERIKQRTQLANQQKNYLNAITMDSEDDYMQKQLTFSGLSEVIKENRVQLASEMRIPSTKLFGQSAAGFNSGEDDIENYNAMIESTIRTQAKFPILTMIELRCQKMFGFIPSDLSVNFKPLRVLSAVQEEEVKNFKFNRALQALQAGAITQDTFIDICNRSELLDVQIENDPGLQIDDVSITDPISTDGGE